MSEVRENVKLALAEVAEQKKALAAKVAQVCLVASFCHIGSSNADACCCCCGFVCSVVFGWVFVWLCGLQERKELEMKLAVQLEEERLRKEDLIRQIRYASIFIAVIVCFSLFLAVSHSVCVLLRCSAMEAVPSRSHRHTTRQSSGIGLLNEMSIVEVCVLFLSLSSLSLITPVFAGLFRLRNAIVCYGCVSVLVCMSVSCLLLIPLCVCAFV